VPTSRVGPRLVTAASALRSPVCLGAALAPFAAGVRRASLSLPASRLAGAQGGSAHSIAVAPPSRETT
jgi:hypothetical protein